MSVEIITENVRSLSQEEEVRIVQDPWDEIAEDAAPLSESDRQLLDERLREHEENPDDVEVWEKVRNQLPG
jgi:putative addiction module component (TIGR02574 family)